MFQFFNLLEDTSALENVALAAVIAGVSRRRAEMRAHELLDLLGLPDKAAELPGVLSGGQRQRLAIARALANEPTLLLADEPTGALDSAGGLEVLELFRRLHAGGQTILLVTHDERVADAAERASCGCRTGAWSAQRSPLPPRPRWGLTWAPSGCAFRLELRSRWRGWLVVALLAGIAGGLVIAGSAGARRTDSALERHLVAYRFPDAWLHLTNSGLDKSTGVRSRRSAQFGCPGVGARPELSYCARDAKNRPVIDLGPQAVQFLVSIDGRDGVALHRPKLLAGRKPDPARPREVLLDTRAAQRFGVRPGDVIPIRVFSSWGESDLPVFHCDPRNQNPAQRGLPERREVRQIWISCKGAAECAGAKREIDRLYVRLRQGASFARLARRYSDVPDAKVTGGALWDERGYLFPAFERVAFRLRTHALSHPFRTRIGWHIVEPLTKVVPVGPLIRLRVVGIKAATEPYPIGTVTLTQAFDRAYRFDIQYSDFFIPVKLRHGAAGLSALARATGTDGRPESDDAAKIQRSLDHEAQALWLACGFGALLALLMLAPALLRLAATAATAHRR